MRTITIHQSDANDIEVLDESDEPLDQYCDSLAELMKMGNIVILKTSSASVVLRPSKIVGIKVEEGAVSESVSLPDNPPPKETEATSQEVDIITDVDN